jgi:hypothetical protein
MKERSDIKKTQHTGVEIAKRGFNLSLLSISHTKYLL